MSKKSDQYDLIQKIVHEARSYGQFEDIEKLDTEGRGLVHLPAQPLYMTLKASSSELVADLLPKMSMEQRQFMIDMDFWRKDVIDPSEFEFWLEAYAKCQDDDVVDEFVSSENFLLYLKSRVNVWTFDVEDPEYPDHDYYFLTDDSLLLIEYSQDYNYPNVLKYLIRRLYSLNGVEDAYAILFKLINDNFSSIQEEQYRFKTDRLRDFGIVDYYEASEKLFPFRSKPQLEKFVLDKKRETAHLNSSHKNQTLHSRAVVAFVEVSDLIHEELLKVVEEFRYSYLNFSFVRMVNSTLVITDSFNGPSTQINEVGKYTKNCVNLGLEYIKSLRSFKDEESAFDYFDFIEVYKIGNTLIHHVKQSLKKALNQGPFASDDLEYFLGTWWNVFLDDLYATLPKVKGFGSGLHPKEVNGLNTLAFAKRNADLLKELLPFIEGLLKAFNQLKTDGKLNDQFYLNYEVDNIDFESILISSLINYSLGHFEGSDINKMGVTIEELKTFMQKFFLKREKEYIFPPLEDEKIRDLISKFADSFGMGQIENIMGYIHGIVSEHLSGYEVDDLELDDFRHVGGPILLNFSLN